ncbi:MAG: DNA helicase RecQ [Synechococcales cyanobacterium]
MTPTEALKHYFGYGSFRPGQASIIQAALDHRDVLAILPTGGGKSLCFQLPALLSSGLTLVVSPLIALMKDQVDQLQNMGIPALFVNSSLSAQENHAALKRLRSGEVKLLYVAPERLLNGTLDGFLQSVNLSRLVVDEAHCVSEWGHDFRPHYRQLRLVRQQFPHLPVMALTATATDRVQQDIHTQLELRDPVVHIASFNRPNLFYEVLEKGGQAQALRTLLGLMRRHRGSTIIYCATRKGVEKRVEQLVGVGIPALPYHAGLPASQREENQTRFIRDDVAVMVATIAFGMGVNKPDVRLVVHYDLPKTIEGYYQESGRAGRDGDPAHCALLFSAADIVQAQWFIRQKTDPETGEPLVAEQRIAMQQLQQMTGYAESGLCRRTLLLGYFGESFAGGCGQCDNCRDPKPVLDWTVDAQKLLSAVKRTGERFGLRYVIEVLRGKLNEKMQQYGHEQLSVFGIGQDKSVREWQQLGRVLVQRGWVDASDDGFGILTLNESSWQILRGQGRVEVPVLKGKGEREPVQKVNDRAEEASLGSVEEALFAQLRKLRKRLADEQSVPPYVIFSDASLRAMCRLRPRNVGEFARVPGVGSKKLERYGALFIAEIQDFGGIP